MQLIRPVGIAHPRHDLDALGSAVTSDRRRLGSALRSGCTKGGLLIGGTVIWINGYFGVGKTTTVEHLTQRLSGAATFDPEEIGFLLRRSVPVPTGDFQDLPAWRHLVAESIVAIMDEHRDQGTESCLLVPMSLTNGRYRTDIFDVLRDAALTVHEFFLTARRNELERRITGQVLFADDPARDEAARQWRLAQLDAAAASLAGLEPKPRILDTTSVSPAEVADAIVEELLVGS